MICAFKCFAGIAKSRFTSDFIMIFAFKCFAGIANSRFHIRFYNDMCFQVLCWYSEFAFAHQGSIMIFTFKASRAWLISIFSKHFTPIFAFQGFARMANINL